MVYLIDTNVIIRFLIGDNKVLFKKSLEIFKQIEEGDLLVEILPSVLMEVYFVLTKFYEVDRLEVIKDLKKFLSLKGIVGDKVILLETLNILEKRKIDFVDAFICSKINLQNYKAISFDKDIEKCKEI
jgi:predicted nucleic acid-binding protein